jgi:hypothetical protein
MNLYKLTQKINNGYDTFDSCIVAAKNEDEARKIHPGDTARGWDETLGFYGIYSGGVNTGKKYELCDYSWCDKPEDVEVQLMGTTYFESGLMIASFNAG